MKSRMMKLKFAFSITPEMPVGWMKPSRPFVVSGAMSFGSFATMSPAILMAFSILP